MRRGFARALRWRTGYWRRRAPGAGWGVAYAVLPFLFFLPLEALPLIEARIRGVLILTWFLALSLGVALAAGRSLRDEDAVWLVQKGISPVDAALEDSILDALLLAGAALWWALLGTLATLPSTPGPWRILLGSFLFGLWTGLLTRTFAGVLSALGARRPSDGTALAAFVSLLAPALTLGQSPTIRGSVEAVLPPFSQAAALFTAVHARDLPATAGELLHLLLFIGAALGVGALGLARWRPRG